MTALLEARRVGAAGQARRWRAAVTRVLLAPSVADASPSSKHGLAVGIWTVLVSTDSQQSQRHRQSVKGGRIDQNATDRHITPVEAGAAARNELIFCVRIINVGCFPPRPPISCPAAARGYRCRWPYHLQRDETSRPVHGQQVILVTGVHYDEPATVVSHRCPVTGSAQTASSWLIQM